MSKNNFSNEIPSHQVALDLYRDGWLSKMPYSYLNAGSADNFNDPRIAWAAPFMDNYIGKRILELGPFEAYNTYQFEKAGAIVISIEGSVDNFLKCLIIKNIFGLKTTFLHGDFNKFIVDTNKFDAVWASGVLYHMVEPIDFLVRVSEWSDKIFIWTQYYDPAILNEDNPAAKHFDLTRDKLIVFFGRTICLHYRSYMTIDDTGLFSGGSDQFSFWLELDDIRFIMHKLGFDQIHIGIDNPDYPPGPACFFMAIRSNSVIDTV
jgi:hypothetical protein